MNLTEALYKAFTVANIVIPNNTKNITRDDVILALTINETELPELLELLGYSASGDGGFKRFRSKLLPNKPTLAKSYIRYILSLISLQQCSKCKEILDVDRFCIDNNDKLYSRSTICRLCDTSRYKDPIRVRNSSKIHYYSNKAYYIAKNATRRARKLLATPSWANKEK